MRGAAMAMQVVVTAGWLPSQASEPLPLGVFTNCVLFPAGVVAGWGRALTPLPGPAGMAYARKEWL